MANAYEAGAAGLPFAVFRGYIGVDLPKVNRNIRHVTCPFTGETFLVQGGTVQRVKSWSTAEKIEQDARWPTIRGNGIKVYEAVRAAGVELLSDPQEMAMGPGLPALRFVCARGPDDEVIELIEM